MALKIPVKPADPNRPQIAMPDTSLPEGSNAPGIPQREPEAPVTAAGTAKAGATGVRGGAEGLVGAPADLVTWELRKAAQLAKYLGASPEVVEAIANYGQDPTRGPGMATTPDVQAATDTAVSALPENISGPIQDITRHQPQNTTEEWAQTGGSFLPAALLPGSAAVRAARVAIPTAGVETTGQVTRQLAPEYEDAARLVAGLVFGGGQALAEGGFRLNSGLRKLNTTPGGMDRVQQLLIEQGMSADDAAAAMKQLGPEGMLLDVGADKGAVLRQEAQKIHARGGEGRSVLGEALETRKAGQEAGLQSDVEAAVGARQQPSTIEAALEDRLTRAQTEQTASHAQQVQPVDLAQLADDLDVQMSSAKSSSELAALKKVRKLLVEEPGDLSSTPPVPETLETTSQQVLKVRQAIRDELYEADGKQLKQGLSPGAKKVLQDAYAKVNEGLDPANPTLRAADAEIHQIGKEEQAFVEGQKIYQNKPAHEGGLTEVEFKQTFDAMSPGEQARILDGLNVETYRQIGIQGNSLVKLKDLMKGEGKWNQQKVAAVIGDEKAQQLMDAISNRATFQDSYQKIVQGSKTAETVSGDAPAGLGGTMVKAIPEMITAGVAGSPGAAAAVGLARLKDWLLSKRTAGRQPALDASVAKLLASGRGDDLVNAAKLMAEKQGGAPQAVLDALLSRQQDVQGQKER